jgi:hypothetical protein
MEQEFLSPRATIPVARRFSAPVSDGEQARLRGLAQKLLRDDPTLARTDFFGSGVFAGTHQGPAVLIGDQREIALFGSLQEQSLEHRIAFLAGGGDVAIFERGYPDFDRFVRDLLDIDGFKVIVLGPSVGNTTAVASRCLKSPEILRQLVAAARAAQRSQIIPLMGAGSAWMLARAIWQAANVPVCVAAPPPRLARRVNDKIWFSNRVRDVLGTEALPPTFAAYGPAATAARMARIARSSERVIVKVPDSAGSAGNVAVDAKVLRRLPLSGVRQLVLTLLSERGWQGRYPLLVGLWDVNATASPSVQLWIPLRDQGPPIIEGIFEQRLAGPDGEFVGAVPYRGAPSVVEEMTSAAARLGWLFQALGYFGRCSFDCLISKDRAGNPTVQWIECNGRWGGVSIPMTLANRLTGAGGHDGMVIVQDTEHTLAHPGFGRACEILGPMLYRRGAKSGIVPLSASCFESGTGVHFLAMAPTQGEAEALAAAALARLCSGPSGVRAPG